MRLIFLGAPGSGKGTQSKFIVEKLSIPQISTGDLLRRAVKAESAVGLEAKGYMDSGSLVPDLLIINLIRHRIEEEDCRKGFILDGFPRTFEQAEALNQFFEETDKSLNAVIYLNIDHKILVQRLTGRRVCGQCGNEYHLEFKKPQVDSKCDLDGADLIHRSDDYDNKIVARLEIFTKQTAPLVDYYTKKGILKEIQAQGEMSDITQSILSALNA
ncbi:MAG: adenylate kinase [bacterium]